eukprot:gene8106-10978_t
MSSFFRSNSMLHNKSVANLEQNPLKLAELRSLLAPTPEINDILDDDDCYRFLIARKNDVPKAFEMLTKWATWYCTTPLPGVSYCPKDVLLHCQEDSKEDVFSSYFIHSNLGEDKEGHPLFWEKTGHVTKVYAEVKKNLTEDEIYVRNIRQQELMIKRLKAQSHKYGRYIGKQSIIFDLKDLAFSVDTAAFSALKKTIAVQEAYYPERLSTMFIINAPSFLPGLWGLVKPWLDPVTAQKIQILGKNYIDKLREFIDDDVIPVEYGGKNASFSWKWPANYELYEGLPLGKLNATKSISIDENEVVTKMNSEDYAVSAPANQSIATEPSNDSNETFASSNANTAAIDEPSDKNADSLPSSTLV